MRTQIIIAGLASLSLLMGACSKHDAIPSAEAKPAAREPKTAVAQPVLPTAPTAEPSPAPTTTAPAEDVVEIKLETVGENMEYSQKALTVQTGKTVHLTLKNNGHSELMPHNWVLVKPGTQAAVALAGVDKKADGYLVEGPDVLAHTPLTIPQKTSEVTFVAPAPGDYPYICTVPGHYMLMKGTLTVTP